MRKGDNGAMRSKTRLVKRIALVFIVTTFAPSAQSQQKSSDPTLVTVDAKGIDALRAKHKGNVLVLNFWATWCKPCVEEFPDLVKLHAQYASRGVNLVFVSIDEDDAKTQKKVRLFLRKNEVTSTSYIKESGDDEQFINAVHPKWSGALPATFVYNKKGELAAMKVEELKLDEIKKIVEPLLR